MAFASFRDFILKLEQEGELMRIAQPIATELEMTEIADREMKKSDGGKALLFEKPTVNGATSPFPVAINTLGSHKRMALSLGASSVSEVADQLGALLKAKPPTSWRDAIKLLGTAFELRHAKPVTVRTGPCKDVIHRFHSGDAPKTSVDELPTLLNLPIQKCWPMDGGRFITLPCVVTRDPDTGERNVGMYRIQIYDSQTTGMHWQLQKVGARHGRRYYETGQPMPVSIFLGGDFVVVINAEKVVVTGKKETEKMFMTYSGWKGGERYTSVAQIRARTPEKLITHAVKGMIPKNRLGRVLLTKLKVYKGSDHPHSAQQPSALALQS